MASSVGARIRRLRRAELRWSEAALLAQAVVALALVRPTLRSFGLRRTQAALTTRSAARSGGWDARHLAWLVDRAAQYGVVRPTCLERSIVLWWLLQRHGPQGQLRIGVRRRPGEISDPAAVDFHAWVEIDGVVINDSRDVAERFATFDGQILPRGAVRG